MLVMSTILISKVGGFTCHIQDIFKPSIEGYSYIVKETGFKTGIEKRAILHGRKFLKRKREALTMGLIGVKRVRKY